MERCFKGAMVCFPVIAGNEVANKPWAISAGSNDWVTSFSCGGRGSTSGGFAFKLCGSFGYRQHECCKLMKISALMPKTGLKKCE